MARETLAAKNNVLKKGVHVVTSPFGYRVLNGKREMHRGIDLVGKNSTLDYIVAIADGKVSGVLNYCSGSSPSTGNYVKIDHGNGIVSVYYHLKKGSVKVKVGDTVKAGTVLGYMGATGNVTGAHLHFGISVNGAWVDPAPYIKGEKTIDAGAPTPTYQVYADGKWYPWVTGYNDTNSDGYAGVEKKVVQAVRAKSNLGSIKYRAHTTDGRWWAWVVDDKGAGADSYAGVFGKNIDLLEMKLQGVSGYSIEYRVSEKNSSSYFPWVKDGKTAGLRGYPIDKVQIRIVKK